MPIWAPPWAILNLTLPGLSLTYFWASSETSGNDAVAPLIVITLDAEATVGSATPSMLTTARRAAVRRIRFMDESSVQVVEQLAGQRS